MPWLGTDELAFHVNSAAISDWPGRPFYVKGSKAAHRRCWCRASKQAHGSPLHVLWRLLVMDERDESSEAPPWFMSQVFA